MTDHGKLPKGGDDAIQLGLKVREATANEEADVVAAAQQLTEEEKTERTQFHKLFTATEAFKFFSNNHVPYLSPGRGLAIALTSKKAERLVRLAYFEQYETAPSSENTRKFLDIKIAQIEAYGPERPVFRRCGEHEGALYYDLCNDGRVIVTTAAGWEVVNEPDGVYFIRGGSDSEKLPLPVRGGNVLLLRSVINLPEQLLKLLIVCLVDALRPGFSHPISVFEGEAGSGKTGAVKKAKFIIDPSQELVRRFPGNERDFGVYASNNHLLTLDNVDKITAGQSDLLCCVSTGGSFGTRTLYSDSDETVLNLQKPTMLTGIQGLVERADAADRTILFQLERVPEEERKTEAELWPIVREIRPQVLGGLFDALAAGLKYLDTVKLERTPRLADFATFVTAAEMGLPWEQGEALEAFYETREDQFEQALQKDRVALALVKFVEREASFGRRCWEGTTADLLGELVPPFGGEGRWPNKPATLGIRITKAMPLLRERGIIVSKRKTNGQQLLVVENSAPTPTLSTLSTLSRITTPFKEGRVQGRVEEPVPTLPFDETQNGKFETEAVL